MELSVSLTQGNRYSEAEYGFLRLYSLRIFYFHSYHDHFMRTPCLYDHRRLVNYTA